MVTVTEQQQQLRRARATSRLVDDFASRLTDRDRYLCRMLYEHRCLTVHQIAALAFDSLNAAQHRLLILHDHRILGRFRPFRPTGSAPFHYVLDQGGAAVVAAERGEDTDELAWRRDKALGIAHSQRLGHLVATNGFFTALAAHARHSRDGSRLAAWWSERRCAEGFSYARPDGYGEWHTPDGDTVRLFLECDMGTEPHDRLAAKLNDYAKLAASTHDKPGLATGSTLLLFWFHSSLREAAFHTRLTHAAVPVATAAAPTLPAGPVWRPLGRPINHRVPLADIAAHAAVVPRGRDDFGNPVGAADWHTECKRERAAATAVDPTWPPPATY